MTEYTQAEKLLLKQLSTGDTLKKVYHDALMLIVLEAMGGDITLGVAKAEVGAHEKAERRMTQLINELVA